MEKRRKLLIGSMLMLSVAFVYIIFDYLKLGMPWYLQPDEPMLTTPILDMYSNNHLQINGFKYPGFNFYYGLLWLKILSGALEKMGAIYVLRLVFVGTALGSNIFLFLGLKKLEKNTLISVLGLLLSLASLYIPQNMYYTGPDVLLYSFGNIALYLGISILMCDKAEKNLYFYYPIFAFVLGIAVSVKYHGILLYVILLYVHFYKKYYKSYKNNFILGWVTILIPLVFVVCNIYMFADFNHFMSDILFNFNHYSGTHPGLDDTMPIISYLRTFLVSDFGILGAGFILLGIFYFIKNKKYNILVFCLIIPILTMLILGRYNLFLARNISFCMPFGHALMVFGIIECKEILDKIFQKQINLSISVVVILVLIMILPNVFALRYISSFEDSRTVAKEYIDANIPEGSSIYVPRMTNIDGNFYMPGIDEQKYKIVTDYNELKSGDYIVDTDAVWRRYYQKDHMIFGGENLYQEQIDALDRRKQNYNKIKDFQGIQWKFAEPFSERYTKVFQYGKEDYYWGPQIDIYTYK